MHINMNQSEKSEEKLLYGKDLFLTVSVREINDLHRWECHLESNACHGKKVLIL